MAAAVVRAQLERGGDCFVVAMTAGRGGGRRRRRRRRRVFSSLRAAACGSRRETRHMTPPSSSRIIGRRTGQVRSSDEAETG